METLLEKAKKIIPDYCHKEISQEDIELALAWLKREISTAQVCMALNNKKTGSYNALYRVALCLRKAFIEDGLLVLKDK